MGYDESLTGYRAVQPIEFSDTGEFSDNGAPLRKPDAISKIPLRRGTCLRSGTAIGGVLLALLATMPLSITPAWADFSIDLAGSNQPVGSIGGTGLVTNSGPGAATLTTGSDGMNTTYSGVIEDGEAATGLTKVFVGELTLTGNNTYSGGTNLNGGIIVVGSNTALGTGNLTVNALSSSLKANTTVSLANAVVLNVGLTIDGGGDLTLGQTISGSGGIRKQGTGVLTLSGNNTYIVGTILNVGTIVVGSNTALGTGALTVGGASTLSANTAVALNNAIALNAGLTIGGSGDLTLSNGISGAGTLTMAGTGVLTLSGSNTFSAGTTLLSGTVSVSSQDSIGGINAHLNLNGGMLRVTGTAFNSIDPSRLSWQNGGGGFDIADAANTFIVSQDLGGNGGLKKAGAGTLVLSGTNSYVGATTVTAGTLGAGSANAFATGSAFDVAAGATLDLNNFNQTIGGLQGAGNVKLGSRTLTAGGNNLSTIFSGTIDGSGALVKKGSGSLALTAASTTWSGDLVVRNGLVLIGDDQALGTSVLTLDGGGVKAAKPVTTLANKIVLTTASGNLIDNGGNRLILSGPIVGTAPSAGVSFAGIGTTVLNGVNTYTGTTLVAAGTLVVGDAAHIGASVAGKVMVATGATLGGSGTVVGDTTVDQGAFIAPGDLAGTLHVTGNLLLSSGSTYNVEIAGSGSSDLIAVEGAATVTGSKVAVTALDPRASYQGGQTYTILTADGGVIGAFDPTVLSHSAFIDASLVPTANKVDLVIALKNTGPVFTPVAETGNQSATAAALDTLAQSGPSLDLYNKLLLLNASEARAAFSALSGEVHASAKSVLIEDSRFVRDAANDRIRAAFAAVGAASMPVLAYGETGSGNDATASIGNALAPADTDRFAAWGSVFGSWGSTDGDSNVAGLDRSTGGFLTGVDGFVAENVRLGMMTGYSHTSFDVDGLASSGKSDNYHVGIYGGTQWGALALRSGLAYTWHNISTNRSVVFPGFADSLSADYDAGTTQAFGELGYRIDTQAASLEPFANLAYVNLHTDGFTEKGGAAALTSAGQTTDATFTTLGVRASADFDVGSAKATARGMIGWRHAFGDVVPTATSAFAGSDAFTVAGVPIAKDAAVIEVGLDFAVGQSATVGLSYNGQFGSGSSDNGGKADLRVKF